jgi:hypothetical protein
MWSSKPANLALFIFIGLALPGMALAQRGGGGGGGVPGPGTPGMSNTGTGTRGTGTATTNPNDSTGTKYRSLTGTIVELNANENSLSVKSLKDGKVTAFTIFPKTKLKAEKKTELADKKDLKLEDFKPGETVEITYMGDGSVSEVRLKHEKEKKDSTESAQKTS